MSAREFLVSASLSGAHWKNRLRTVFPFPGETISVPKRETALSGGFLLFLNFLVDFAGPSVRVELLKLDLTLYLLLILASTANVSGSRAQ